jgi:hypothetical protein
LFDLVYYCGANGDNVELAFAHLLTLSGTGFYKGRTHKTCFKLWITILDEGAIVINEEVFLVY